MARIKLTKLDDWIDRYMEYTEPQESSEDFHLGVALWIMSCALSRRCWIYRGFYNTYPNLYIVLVAGSAGARKSLAISIGREFVETCVSTPIFAQKCTEQSLIEEIKTKPAQGTIPGKTESHAILCSSELIKLLGEKDINILSLLTDLFDCPNTWKYRTITRQMETLRNVWLNLLGASTPNWMRSAIPETAIGGGFMSRILLIYSSGTDKRTPRPEVHMTQARINLKAALIEDLKYIASYEGVFIWTKAAEEWFDTWYMEVYNPNTEGEMSGYYGRKHELLLKIVMCLRVAYSGSLKITVNDFERGLKIINMFEKDVPTVLRHINTTDLGNNAQKVYNKIKSAGEIEHSKLFRAVSYFCDGKMLSEITSDLAQQDLITSRIKVGTNRVIYVIKEKYSWK